MILWSCAVTLFMFPHHRTWFVLLTSPTNHSWCISCRYRVKSAHLNCRVVTETLHCSFSSDFAWLIPPTLTPSSDENWFVLFGFSVRFSPQRFFTAMSAVYFLRVCPSRKRKGHAAGARQQAKVDTNVIETGYWYSPCWLPAHLGRELFLLCTLSMEVFLLSLWVFCSFMFSLWAWTLLGSLVTSYFHAFSVHSWLVHCICVRVTS